MFTQNRDAPPALKTSMFRKTLANLYVSSDGGVRNVHEDKSPEARELAYKRNLHQFLYETDFLRKEVLSMRAKAAGFQSRSSGEKDPLMKADLLREANLLLNGVKHRQEKINAIAKKYGVDRRNKKTSK